jgi:hypothetical protein
LGCWQTFKANFTNQRTMDVDIKPSPPAIVIPKGDFERHYTNLQIKIAVNRGILNTVQADLIKATDELTLLNELLILANDTNTNPSSN